MEIIGSLPVCLGFNLSRRNLCISQKTREDAIHVDTLKVTWLGECETVSAPSVDAAPMMRCRAAPGQAEFCFFFAL